MIELNSSVATGSVLIIVQILFKNLDTDQDTVQLQPDQNNIRTRSQPDQDQVSYSFTCLCLCLYIKTSECKEGGTFPVCLSLCLSLSQIIYRLSDSVGSHKY